MFGNLLIFRFDFLGTKNNDNLDVIRKHHQGYAGYLTRQKDFSKVHEILYRLVDNDYNFQISRQCYLEHLKMLYNRINIM